MLDLKPLDPTIRCGVGESPVYDDRENALLFEDIVNRTIHSIALAGGVHRQWHFPSEVGAFGLTGQGRLIVALRHEVGLFDRGTGTFERLCTVEDGNPDTRLNDGKVGPDGAFWVGSMDDRGRPASERLPLGSLYRIDGSGRVEKKVEGLITSNGVAWSADGRTMFHTDSSGRWIDRWRFDPATGEIAGRTRIRAEIDDADGRPDGGACDMEGCYWSAGVSAARLNRYAADGRLVASYPVPLAAPTMPCFAGPDLKTLFVTSLTAGRSAEALARYPLSGMVLMGPSPVAGVPVSRFRDA
jgi:sugar lactone lactonase YvrE